ncbi:MAG TPA: tagaturonate epimerase family protein [Tepidisphaeraceae bacterium]|jgi:hypothetical protein
MARPISPLGLSPSFGFGDRLGIATPGHVDALRQAGGGILPIFAQQSIREMTRTQRSAERVIQDALTGAQAAGYSGTQGADADHLKTPADVDHTAQAGFRFFTIDPSDYVDGQADTYDHVTLEEKFSAAREHAPWLNQYNARQVQLSTGTKIAFDEAALKRAAVKYGRAIEHANAMAKHIDTVMQQVGEPYEIELSIDETPQPTTVAEHYIIAEQVLRSGMKLVSLAPRFIGEFEKGVDFKGDLSAFERSLADHAAIARALGPYKLSLHSGSDKLSIYGMIARTTQGCFHVKTAGTSYLEALRAISRHDLDLFREIIDFSRARYDIDRATYHVSATLAAVAPPSDIADARQLEKTYLGLWADQQPGTGLSDPGRQILHTTFGSVLTHERFEPAIMQILREHPDTYRQVLADHFSRHLHALR